VLLNLPGQPMLRWALRASTSFVLALRAHVDLRRGTGVDWHLSGESQRGQTL